MPSTPREGRPSSLRAPSEPLPPDRGHLETEQPHGASATLDALDTAAGVDLMVEDHRAVTAALAAARDDLAAFIDDLVLRMRRGGRLVYVGAGTSGRLGVLDASECPPTFRSHPDRVVGIIAGGDAALRRSSEGLEDDPEGAVSALEALDLGPDDTLLGIAAGGTTPYVHGAIAAARARGALTAFLTCAANAAAPPDCPHVIRVPTGPELLTGSTRLKAGSATKLALNVITTLAFTRLGHVHGNLMVNLRATNDKLRDRAIRIIVELCPGTTREEAAQVLAEADDELKTAVAMRRMRVGAGEARDRLARAGGHLREVMGG